MRSGASHSSARHAVAIAITLACSAASTARAQNRNTTNRASTPDSHYDGPIDTFVQGVRAYEAQDYTRALTIFQRVYELTQRPEILFNIGMTQLQLQHHVEAVRAFRQYLTRLPNAPNRADVESRISFLEGRIRADEQAAAAQTSTPSPSSAPSTHDEVRVRRPVAALVVGGVGVLSLAGSLTFALLRLDAIGNCTPNGNTLECPTDADAMRAERGRGYTIATDVTLGIGIAAVTAGVLWYVLGARTEHVQVAFEASSTSAGLRIGGAF